jgi:hypothetical protein
MKFMCLVTCDADLAAAMTADDWKEMDRQSQAYDRGLMERGVFLAAEALVAPDAARTVRVRSGRAMITDGPFAETKETVAGFILIDVADADAAMEVARGIPMARLGGVEVRPVMEFG